MFVGNVVSFSKCLHANMALGFLMSLWRLFSLILKFLTFVHIIFYIRYIPLDTYALEKLTSRNNGSDLLVCWLLKADGEINCFQQVSYYLLNMGSIYVFPLCWYIFVLCYTRFCCYRLVPSNVCCVWEVLPVYFK